jgi:hypothetical protein
MSSAGPTVNCCSKCELAAAVVIRLSLVSSLFLFMATFGPSLMDARGSPPTPFCQSFPSYSPFYSPSSAGDVSGCPSEAQFKVCVYSRAQSRINTDLHEVQIQEYNLTCPPAESWLKFIEGGRWVGQRDGLQHGAPKPTTMDWNRPFSSPYFLMLVLMGVLAAFIGLFAYLHDLAIMNGYARLILGFNVVSIDTLIRCGCCRKSTGLIFASHSRVLLVGLCAALGGFGIGFWIFAIAGFAYGVLPFWAPMDFGGCSCTCLYKFAAMESLKVRLQLLACWILRSSVCSCKSCVPFCCMGCTRLCTRSGDSLLANTCCSARSMFHGPWWRR